MHRPSSTLFRAPASLVAGAVTDTRRLMQSSGELVRGDGLASGVIAFGLGFLSLLAVLAFRYPAFLTTPELRELYSHELLRHILFASLVISGSIALANVLMNRRRSLNFAALLCVAAAAALGGSAVQVAEYPLHTPYIGLDWFILDLLGSTIIFVLIEKSFPLYKGQLVFRPEWQTDLVHFTFNHFIVGLVLLTVNFLIHRIFGWMVWPPLQVFTQAIPFVPQLLLCILAADLVQYWTHRAYHEVPFLWRFHAVHHSVKTMDWLAGSRQHILELVATRVGVLGCLYVLGFDKGVMDLYIVIVGFQAVFNHANVHLPFGPVKWFIVTPDFHHWHHSSEAVAIDRNYAAHYAFLDRLFGTAIKGQTGFPKEYGVVGDYMPAGFVRQQAFPFVARRSES